MENTATAAVHSQQIYIFFFAKVPSIFSTFAKGSVGLPLFNNSKLTEKQQKIAIWVVLSLYYFIAVFAKKKKKIHRCKVSKEYNIKVNKFTIN